MNQLVDIFIGILIGIASTLIVISEIVRRER